MCADLKYSGDYLKLGLSIRNQLSINMSPKFRCFTSKAQVFRDNVNFPIKERLLPTRHIIVIDPQIDLAVTTAVHLGTSRSRLPFQDNTHMFWHLFKQGSDITHIHFQQILRHDKSLHVLECE